MNNPAMITAMRKKVQAIKAKMTGDPLTEDQPLKKNEMQASIYRQDDLQKLQVR